jgi:hypothetical protein
VTYRHSRGGGNQSQPEMPVGTNGYRGSPRLRGDDGRGVTLARMLKRGGRLTHHARQGISKAGTVSRRIRVQLTEGQQQKLARLADEVLIRR